MTGRRRQTRRQRRRYLCSIKARYSTWDAAEKDGLRVWLAKPVKNNPALPYPCDICDGYHLATHVVPMPRTREKWLIRVA